MINFMYMIRDVIAQSFTRAVGRWQGEVGDDSKPSERKALLVLFKVKKRTIQMLIHAPMNYIGVYTRKGNLKGTSYGKWECLSYHDSCWITDGIDRFLYQYEEDIHFCSFPTTKGFDVIGTITNAIHVVKLDKVQLDGLKQIRDRKYN